jgi:hypothetical protein
MTLIGIGARRLLPEAFQGDPHAARYVGVLEAYPVAFDRLLDLLNDPLAERLLEHESEQGHAALRAIVGPVESDPVLHAAVVDDTNGQRFRQAVGVAIRLKMARLGWTTSGRKGPVGGASFTRAEKYVRLPSQPPHDASHALATLDRVATIGTDTERHETGEQLMSALRSTRAELGRPF